MAKDYTAVGIAWSPHPQKKSMIVVQFAGNFVDSGNAPQGAPVRDLSGQQNCATHIVIISEKMTGTDPKELVLVARGKSLNLTNKKSTSSHHEVNCRWQLPISFDPAEIDAYFVESDLTVYIHVPKKSSSNNFPSIQQEIPVSIRIRRN